MPPKPPIAPRKPHTERRHGREVDDPYFWLRQREDPDVLRYLEQENAYAAAVMEDTAALQERLYQEMRGRIKETDESVPSRFGDFFYYSRTVEGQQYSYHCRKPGSLEAEEQLLLDENALAEGHDYFRLGAFRISPDHRLLAYSVDTDGSERYTLRVKDLETGELLPDEVPGSYTSVEWGNDNRTLFYNTVDDAHRPHRLYRHRLGDDPANDVLVYEEPDDGFFLGLYKTKNKRFLILHMDSHTTSEARFLDADTPEAEPALVEPRRHMVEYSVEHHGNRFLILTNDGAINFKLVEAPVASPGRAHWSEILPHDPQVKLDDVQPFENHLAIFERRDGLRGVRVWRLSDGAAHRVEFPEPVHVVWGGGNPEFASGVLRFVYTSPVTPETVFDYDMESRERQLMKEREVLGGYDRERYRCERRMARADDGTEIPISLVYRLDLRGDGPSPLLLYGYGSYGYPVDPDFESNRISLLDRGFVYAIAHVRGGGDLGRPWYEAGKLLVKRNTFTDFIRAGEELIEAGYTASDRLVIKGASAGGLLVGASVNMRPELFRLVVAKVPFVDVINTMCDASLPLTVIEWEEWGDPREPEYHDYMQSYSPYDNVEAKDYPAMLITAGLNDPRVAYWEPAKWAARLRAVKTDDNLLLLRTEMGAGHSGPSGRYSRLRDVAFEYAVILKTLGMKS